MILVIDVGTTSLRAAIVDGDGRIARLERREFPPASPAPGLVEFDPTEMGRVVLEAATALLADARTEGMGDITAVGVTTQRASAVVWDRATGRALGPGLGWQDLRTVGECITARIEHGVAIAPNQTVTKAAWLLANAVPDGADVCIGTVDSWIVWLLSEGALHVTDDTNAAVTGMYDARGRRWDPRLLDVFGIPESALPRIVDTSGVIGPATALPGSPPIAAVAGDQQASLVGQGCVRPGMTKITFGTGAMLDICAGDREPASLARSEHGTFPIVAWSHDGTITWGVECIMLSAGTNVDWLRDDLGVITTSAESHDLAAGCAHSDGVVYVPALLGLGTPQWDYGARGTLLGVTRGTTRAHVVRAVLEGVAHRGADLLAAAVTDTGLEVDAVRIDGGMSQNPTFCQALADACGVRVEVSPVVEATTVGAGLLAGLAIGTWAGPDDLAAAWEPVHVYEPDLAPGPAAARRQWHRAVERAGGWIPDLSALDF